MTPRLTITVSEAADRLGISRNHAATYADEPEPQGCGMCFVGPPTLAAA